MAKKPTPSTGTTDRRDSPDVVFNIRVFLLNPDKCIKEVKDFEITESDEITAFNKLPTAVKQIHDGEWQYAGYFKISKK
jgi:hypothetical protein